MSIIHKLIILTLCLCASVPLCLSTSSATIYPSELKIAPIKVYESILTNFKEKKYENVKTAIVFVTPIIDAINTEFGVDIKTEIQSGLKARDEKFNIAMRRLIFYDICLIFTTIKDGKSQSPSKLRILFKMSYANYSLLSTEFLRDKENFDIDRKVRKSFTKAYLDLGKESPYGEKTASDLNAFKVHSNEIIEGLVEAFPEFQGEK